MIATPQAPADSLFLHRQRGRARQADAARHARQRADGLCVLFRRRTLANSAAEPRREGLHLQYWSEVPHGGHFAAMEEPALFVQDVRAWAKTLKL
jgi:pimeloyl-ACP methyl ester carboxylesterase